MIRDDDGSWHCGNCGHALTIDRRLAMETALEMADLPGPCSAGDMTFAELGVYVRNLELRWMEDQRQIRQLQRRTGDPLSFPVPIRPAC